MKFKKSVLLIFILILSIGLIACGSNESEDEKTNNSSQTGTVAETGNKNESNTGNTSDESSDSNDFEGSVAPIKTEVASNGFIKNDPNNLSQSTLGYYMISFDDDKMWFTNGDLCSMTYDGKEVKEYNFNAMKGHPIYPVVYGEYVYFFTTRLSAPMEIWRLNKNTGDGELLFSGNDRELTNVVVLDNCIYYVEKNGSSCMVYSFNMDNPKNNPLYVYGGRNVVLTTDGKYVYVFDENTNNDLYFDIAAVLTANSFRKPAEEHIFLNKTDLIFQTTDKLVCNRNGRDGDYLCNFEYNKDADYSVVDEKNPPVAITRKKDVEVSSNMSHNLYVGRNRKFMIGNNILINRGSEFYGTDFYVVKNMDFAGAEEVIVPNMENVDTVASVGVYYDKLYMISQEKDNYTLTILDSEGNIVSQENSTNVKGVVPPPSPTPDPKEDPTYLELSDISVIDKTEIKYDIYRYSADRPFYIEEAEWPIGYRDWYDGLKLYQLKNISGKPLYLIENNSDNTYYATLRIQTSTEALEFNIESVWLPAHTSRVFFFEEKDNKASDYKIVLLSLRNYTSSGVYYSAYQLMDVTSIKRNPSNLNDVKVTIKNSSEKNNIYGRIKALAIKDGAVVKYSTLDKFHSRDYLKPGETGNFHYDIKTDFDYFVLYFDAHYKTPQGAVVEDAEYGTNDIEETEVTDNENNDNTDNTSEDDKLNDDKNSDNSDVLPDFICLIDDVLRVDDSFFGITYEDAKEIIGADSTGELLGWEWDPAFDSFCGASYNNVSCSLFFKNNALKGVRYEIDKDTIDNAFLKIYKKLYGKYTSRTYPGTNDVITEGENGWGYHFNTPNGYVEVFYNYYEDKGHVAMDVCVK